MAKRKKKLIIFSVLLTILVALIAWIIWGNTALQLNTYTITAPGLPEPFNGYRIAHVSDLHNTEIGRENGKLLNMLMDVKPDIIAVTGDLLDSRNTDVGTALEFIREAVEIAPVYYVTGNHEARLNEYEALKLGMEDAGVTVLEDSCVELSAGEETVTLIGINDPSFQTDYLFGDAETVVEEKLAELNTNEDGFTILLSHRPELFDVYVEYGMDLVLSGHAHGGQIRLPFIGGLAAPNQGLFPDYDSGLYTKENTNMLVSRGVGNSIIPFRINNRPEVILIELQTF